MNKMFQSFFNINNLENMLFFINFYRHMCRNSVSKTTGIINTC